MDRVIEDLLEITEEQSDNIHKLTDIVRDLAAEVDSRPTKGFLYKVIAGVFTLLVTGALLLNYAAYNTGNAALEEIKSCTTPEGECAMRSAEGQRRAIGAIICNQEKVLYYQYYEGGYTPQPFCIQYVNSEIDRLDAVVGLPPKLEVPEGVAQYTP